MFTVHDGKVSNFQEYLDTHGWAADLSELERTPETLRRGWRLLPDAKNRTPRYVIDLQNVHLNIETWCPRDNYNALAKLGPRLVLLTHINEVGLLSSLFK